jgi:hypothetical protein
MTILFLTKRLTSERSELSKGKIHKLTSLIVLDCYI